MNPNRKIPKILPLLIVAFVAYSAYRIWPGSPGAPSRSVQLAGPTMGTTWQVKLADAALSPAQREALTGAIGARLAGINDAMSTYIDSSELSRFNQNPTTSPVPVSTELFEVVQLARTVSETSGGAFDVTVGPLVNAWGFGPEERDLPSAGRLQELRARVGYHMLSLNPATPALTKARGDLYVDLSAIAKGYAVDQVSTLLHQRGFPNHMVEIGGEIIVSGVNPTRGPWRLAIERPSPDARNVHEIIRLSSGALATSGDYRNYIEREGKRYSHTIDPRIGAPVSHHLASVSVVAKDCATADAYATALNVLGEKEGFDLAVAQDLAALFIIREPDGAFSSKVTPQFEPFRAIMDQSP